MNHRQSGQRGASAVELTFMLLGAGIVLIAIFQWLVPAMTLQSNIAAGREAVGLASTLEGSVGRLGEGGQIIDVGVAQESAASFATNLFDNSGQVARAEAFQTTRTSGLPNCQIQVDPIQSAGATCMECDGFNCASCSGLLLTGNLKAKIESAAKVECLAKDYYIGTEYKDPRLQNMVGLHVARKAGFQPDIFVPSGGSGSGP